MFDGTSYDWVGKNMFAYRTCMYSVYYFSSLTAYCYLHVYWYISSLYSNYSFPPPTMADEEQSVDDIRNKEKQVSSTQVYLNKYDLNICSHLESYWSKLEW